MSRHPDVRTREPSDEDRARGVRIYLLVDVTPRRVSDGVERVHRDTYGWAVFEDESEVLAGARYLWLEGNYACDCNRALFFARAGDEDDVDVECGHGRYVIVAPEWLVT